MIGSPKIMGILNVTPDSFFDGGSYYSVNDAVKQALQMAEEGADIIDIGGESSRPHSQPVSLQEELDRVIPVIEKIKNEIHLPLSIDTYKPQVMKAAIAAGATIVNDITALQNPNALQIVKQNNVSACLMHMQGTPQTMQASPHYEDVVAEVYDFLQERLQACLQAGISKEKIMIDPGFGFGKSVTHNTQLLKNLDQFRKLDCSILVGLSRKSFIGTLLNQPDPKDRLYGSLAASLIAVSKGARIFRTHDVKATRQVVDIAAQFNVDGIKASSDPSPISFPFRGRIKVGV